MRIRCPRSDIPANSSRLAERERRKRRHCRRTSVPCQVREGQRRRLDRAAICARARRSIRSFRIACHQRGRTPRTIRSAKIYRAKIDTAKIRSAKPNRTIVRP